MSQNHDGLSDLRLRIENQVSSHWQEFAVIVVSGNIGAALLAGGFIVAGDEPIGSKVVLAAILLASVEAFALAYYSIHVGSLQVRGPMRLGNVVDSFGIAAAQFAMPLWISYITRAFSLNNPRSLLVTSRHWLAFAGVFALFAALANERGARSRSRSPETPKWITSFLSTLRGTGAGLHRAEVGEPDWLKDYNDHQWEDRCGAARVGVLLMVMWSILLTASSLPSVLSAGLVGCAFLLAIVGFTMGLRSQSEIVRKLVAHLAAAGMSADLVQVHLETEVSADPSVVSDVRRLDQ